jgi:parvulin-like peptidyl-prolyl isomerase
MPEGTWSTVESTYGTHLVRLDARTAALPAERAARKARVDADARGREAERALVEGLRARHAIRREARPEDAP